LSLYSRRQLAPRWPGRCRGRERDRPRAGRPFTSVKRLTARRPSCPRQAWPSTPCRR